MNTLFASGLQESRSSKGMMISMALHGGLIAAALYGTSQVLLPPREKFEEHPVLYVSTPPPTPIHVAPEPLPAVKAPPKARATPAPRRVALRPQVVAPVVKPATPALVAPTKIALSLPAMDLKAPPTITDVVATAAPEPARAATAGTGGAAGRSGDADGASAGGLGSGSSGRAYDENQVDRAVEITRVGKPSYPAALRSVNVEGAVTMSFIVGTDGRVEPNSIKVISTPHRLFADAVRTALLATRYRAAEANGHAVRQLVEQSFSFKLDKQ